MSIINTNISTLVGQASLRTANSALGTAMERLSSGLRINSASDDAAGQGIANRMQANINAHSAIIKGMNDGVSLMQTAEGGLDSINQMLQRGRELAVQAATGTLSDSDRLAIHNEFVQIREQIDYTAANTQIFGKTPLAERPPEALVDQLGDIKSIRDIDPMIGQRQTSGLIPLGFIPQDVVNFEMEMWDVGANDDIQIFTQDGKHLIGTSVQAGSTWSDRGVSTEEQLEQRVFTAENGFSDGARYDDSALLDGSTFFDPENPRSITYNGMTLTYSGDGNPQNPRNLTETLTIDEITEPLFVMVTGNGEFRIDEFTWQDAPPPPPKPYSGSVDIVSGASFGKDVATITIDPAPSDSVTLGIDTIDLSEQASASDALAKFDAALNIVDGYRGQYGALANRFEWAMENHDVQRTNTAESQSRIRDADYAVEIANMTRAQILQQAGTSMLAQANQQTQTVLSLLG